MQAEHLAITIRKLYHLSMQAMERELLKIGLTPQQVMVLKLLAHDGPLQHHELMQKIEVSKGTMSGILKRLEDKQLVERTVLTHDRRNVRFGFTEKGLAFAREFHDMMDNAMNGLFKDVPPAELEDFENTLIQMIKYLEEK